MALNDLDAEEVGKVVTQLQEEITIIKMQLENLPGYDKGKYSNYLPPASYRLVIFIFIERIWLQMDVMGATLSFL